MMAIASICCMSVSASSASGHGFDTPVESIAFRRWPTAVLSHVENLLSGDVQPAILASDRWNCNCRIHARKYRRARRVVEQMVFGAQIEPLLAVPVKVGPSA